MIDDPVMVTPPGGMVSLPEAKDHLRVNHTDEDALINGLIAAVSAHMDGPDGTLARAVMAQTWREEFDGFCATMPLRVSPAASIVSLSYVDSMGVDQVVADARIVRTGGQSLLCPAVGAQWPNGTSVVVTYTAGADTAPAPLKSAALLHIGTLYEHRESVAEKAVALLPHGYHSLVWPYRRSIV